MDGGRLRKRADHSTVPPPSTVHPRPSSLASRARAAIRQHALLRPGESVLVAVSGGADSVALLHVLHTLAKRQRWALTVAHLHHGLRAAADGDAAFVSDLARRLGVPCVVSRVRVAALAKRCGISVEMAAREARYAFFARTAKNVGAAVVAVAHTADDQAETVLLRLIRGAGPAGLAGIPRMSDHHGLRIVRPLLDFTRHDVLAHLNAHDLGWREDESNLDQLIPRNRVRHELLPLLEREFNPRVREAVLRASRLIRDDNAFLDVVAAGLRRSFGKDLGVNEIDVEQVQACTPALRRRVLRLWLRDAGVPESGLEFETIERLSAFMAQVGSSRLFVLSDGWRVVRGSAAFRVDRPVKPSVRPVRVRLQIPGETVVAGLGLRIRAELGPGVVRERGGGPGCLPARASLNAAAWRSRAVYVRTWRPGDRLQPFGLAGTKKVQDILVDAKTPREVRGRIPLIECGGELVWLPGYRIARGWEVPADAPTALQLTISHIPLEAGACER